MSRTDWPVAQAQPADDNNLPTRVRHSYLTQAHRTITESNQTDDPVTYRRRWLDHLEARAEQAERWAHDEETSLRAAVEAMQRREAAERAARRAAKQNQRLRAAETADAERLRRNARQRATYARKRAQGEARIDNGRGVHATAITVHPDAYTAVKTEAYDRRQSIPTTLGQILSNTPLPPPAPQRASEPRWRRTGQGRQANQHTRIHLDDHTWHQLHHDAITHNHTFARHLGHIIEHWATVIHRYEHRPSS